MKNINKKYIKELFILLFSLVVISMNAQNTIRWMQQPSVSPDAKWIAFEYQGNIYKVESTGGIAIQLTHEPSYNGYPVWSHDGSRIAFASDRNGNFDVFIMNASGDAEQQRLTFDSAKDIPFEFSKDNQYVYFGTTRHDTYSSVRYPADHFFLKLFKVASAGGASLMVNSAGMDFAHYNQRNDCIIFQDNKGSVEDNYRKHATSSVTRDIWTLDTKTGQYSKVSPYIGEDREPIWGEGDNFYYLSERGGNQNLFKSSVTDISKVKQLTFFDQNPVRNLSRAINGSLFFTQNGDLYSLKEGGDARKLLVQICKPSKDSIATILVKSGSSDFDVSSDGKQIAFVVRGDIYVISTDKNSNIRRITNTPYIERMVNFSPDGKNLLFSVEKGSSWDIKKVTIGDASQTYFYNSGKLITTDVINGLEDEFQGVYSPNGKKIAFLENREILKVYDLASKKVETLLPYGINFSTKDGDQSFIWSPDSKFILVQNGHHNIFLISIENPENRINVTKSAFENIMPHWGNISNTMYYLSAKNGLTNFTHSQNQFDIMETFFSKEAWYTDRFGSLISECLNNQNIRENKIDLFKEVLYHRKQITSSQANIKDFAISKDGKSIYLLASYENDFNLYTLDIGSSAIHLLAGLNVQDPKMKLTDNGNTIVVLGGNNQFQIIDTSTGNISPIHINTKADINITQERNSTYDHIYNLEKKRFFDPKLNDVDFKYYFKNYKQFLANINNGYDFKLLIEELLGELNTSHLVTQYNPTTPKATYTASLGLLYDLSGSDGLKVKEIIADGPFDNQNSKMRKDFIIDQIDGHKITVREDWAKYLNNKIDSTLCVSFYDSNTGNKYKEQVKAINSRTENMEDRWVKQMEHLTDSLSGGKIGYAYLSQMDEDNFRLFYDKVLGSYRDKKALIVDTRFNDGGDLLDLLISFLGGRLYLTENRQGSLTPGGEPETKWNKPSCIIMNEANYSDAFRVPFVYKNLGLGKLVGMPVPGTGTAAGIERQLTPGLSILIPQGGTYFPGDTHPTENHQLAPDILINNDYSEILNGRDQQIEAAVKHLLETIP